MERPYSDLQLGSLEAFCAAAELASFTKAASALALTPAAVSRAIARLEARLGVRLFVRTTRRIRLTDAGEQYYQHCRSVLSQLAEAERQVTGSQIEPAGVIRISVPTTYGHHRILPLLPEFRARYPKVRIDAHVSNRNIDFAEEGFDLAVRIRAPEDSRLIVRKLEEAPIVTVASPVYLARCGTPQTPEQLNEHDCIQFALPSTGRKVPWLFLREGERFELETSGNYFCYEDVNACVVLARSGAGLLQTLRFLFEPELANGELVEVLQPYAGCSRQVSLLYPHGRHLPQRVRLFVDFLLEKLRS